MATSIDLLKEKGRRLRIDSLKATTEAGSGHPSSCLSAADLVSVVFFREMQFDPKDPHSPANDRLRDCADPSDRTAFRGRRPRTQDPLPTNTTTGGPNPLPSWLSTNQFAGAGLFL